MEILINNFFLHLIVFYLHTLSAIVFLFFHILNRMQMRGNGYHMTWEITSLFPTTSTPEIEKSAIFQTLLLGWRGKSWCIDKKKKLFLAVHFQNTIFKLIALFQSEIILKKSHQQPQIFPWSKMNAVLK